MKNMIVCIALTVLFLILLQYQSDVNLFIRNTETVQAMVEDAALSASLFYDEESYRKGEVVFKADAADLAYKRIQSSLNRDYWQGGYLVEVTCYSEDDNKAKHIYSYEQGRGLISHVVVKCKPHRAGVGVDVMGLTPKFKSKTLMNLDKKISRKASYVYHGYDENLESN